MGQDCGGTPEQFLDRKRKALEGGSKMGVSLTSLSLVAQMSGRPTPMAGTPAQNGNNAAGNSDYTRKVVELVAPAAGWATPMARDHFPPHTEEYVAAKKAQGHGMADLNDQVMIVGWATPAERDYRTPNHKSFAERGGGTKGEQLNNQVAHMIPGASLSGSPALTAGTGLLNPEFSRWLQGIPATWPSCAPTGTRSTRSSRASS